MFTWLKHLFSRKPQGESYEDFLKRWNAKLDGSDFYEPTLGIFEPTCYDREDGHSLEKYRALTDPNYYDALWEGDYPHDPAFYDDHQRFVDDMYASADAYGYDDDGTLFGEIEDEEHV